MGWWPGDRTSAASGSAIRQELVDLARACFGLGLAREAVALEAMRAGLGVVPTDRELEAGRLSGAGRRSGHNGSC